MFDSKSSGKGSTPRCDMGKDHLSACLSQLLHGLVNALLS